MVARVDVLSLTVLKTTLKLLATNNLADSFLVGLTWSSYSSSNNCHSVVFYALIKLIRNAQELRRFVNDQVNKYNIEQLHL